MRYYSRYKIVQKFMSITILLFLAIPAFLWGGFFTRHQNDGKNRLADSSYCAIPVRLKWSEKEVRDIADMVGGDACCRCRATEKEFKRLAPEAGIIHIATHARVDDENPMFSKLVFSADPSSEEDGCLNTYELYNMNLNADMVVLSACNTGCGKLIGGEGIMNLARGFVYAGCQSVVLSLWSVDDQSNSVLMKKFYRELSEGRTKDQALRQAKLELMQENNSAYSDPFYWAGMVSMGNPDPVQVRNRKNIHAGFIMPAGAVFTVLILLVGSRARKRGTAGGLLLNGLIFQLMNSRNESAGKFRKS
jgi:hypothetical protein